MALFTKKEFSTDRMPLYEMGTHKTYLIVGLGNFGKPYDHTRHNIGFDVVDKFAELNDFPGWTLKKDLKAHITKNRINEATVILIKPTTYMNESGQAVHAVQNFYKIPCTETLIIQDELDLNFSQIRTRSGGSSGGNKGVQSVINLCGQDFGRVRIGISNDKVKVMEKSDFVLAKFSNEEQKQIPSIISEAGSIISEYVVTGQLPNHTLNLDLE
ncbi:MAG: aminoacyl-tRNA hydrolase [bacterium]|nr:aminoacyl-tRNA hydrolase [bacterium]